MNRMNVIRHDRYKHERFEMLHNHGNFARFVNDDGHMLSFSRCYKVVAFDSSMTSYDAH